MDFICCQEELERILGLQEALLERVERSQGASPADLSASVAGRSVCSSWCTTLMARISLGHIMHARGMSMQDWCKMGCQGFIQLSALLELANRDLQLPLPVPPALMGDPTEPSSTAAAAAAGSERQQQSNLGSAQSSATAPAGAGAAGQSFASASTAAPGGDNPAADNFAASAAGAAASAAASAVGQGHEALTAFVEQGIMLAFAAMFYNPQPYYAAAACNLSTGQVELMPQAQLMHAVSRMQLTWQQVMHLRIVNIEFVRLARVTSQVNRLMMKGEKSGTGTVRDLAAHRMAIHWNTHLDASYMLSCKALHALSSALPSPGIKPLAPCGLLSIAESNTVTV